MKIRISYPHFTELPRTGIHRLRKQPNIISGYKPCLQQWPERYKSVWDVWKNDIRNFILGDIFSRKLL